MSGGSAGAGPSTQLGEKAGVQTGYVVTRGLQDRHHNGAQIALMPGDKYSHSPIASLSRADGFQSPAASALFECHVAFSTMKASACALRHCTPRSLDRPRNASSSNQSWLVCDG